MQRHASLVQKYKLLHYYFADEKLALLCIMKTLARACTSDAGARELPADCLERAGPDTREALALAVGFILARVLPAWG